MQPSFYLNLNERVVLRPPLHCWGSFDRTRTLFNLVDIKELIPLGTLVSNLSFAGLCDERAKELASIADSQNKKLYVMWSGGIDSTLVLVALLKIIGPERIVVVMNDHSVKEYPLFYSEHIQGRLTELHYKPGKEMYTFIDAHVENGLFVTGEIADQLFGSMAYLNYKDIAVIEKNWRFGYDTHHPQSIDKLEAFVATCPQQITSIKEFLWWVNYAVKYQGVCLRFLIDAEKAVLGKNFFHFFHTSRFNDWAVSTPIEEKFYGVDMKNYKMLAKDYIYAFTKDNEYRLHKIKEPSAGSGGAHNQSKYKTIDFNWNRGL